MVGLMQLHVRRNPTGQEDGNRWAVGHQYPTALVVSLQTPRWPHVVLRVSPRNPTTSGDVYHHHHGDSLNASIWGGLLLTVNAMYCSPSTM